jgi:hypothetical protein
VWVRIAQIQEGELFFELPFSKIKFEYFKLGATESTFRHLTFGNFRRTIARLRKEVHEPG